MVNFSSYIDAVDVVTNDAIYAETSDPKYSVVIGDITIYGQDTKELIWSLAKIIEG